MLIILLLLFGNLDARSLTSDNDSVKMQPKQTDELFNNAYMTDSSITLL